MLGIRSVERLGEGLATLKAGGPRYELWCPDRAKKFTRTSVLFPSCVNGMLQKPNKNVQSAIIQVALALVLHQPYSPRRQVRKQGGKRR